jgi:hypothetical protein
MAQSRSRVVSSTFIYFRGRMTKMMLCALCAGLFQVAFVTASLSSFPFTIDKFQEIKREEVPADLRDYLKDQNDGRYEYKIAEIINDPIFRLTAIRIISKDCNGMICPTYFEYQSDQVKFVLVLHCSEWLRLYHTRPIPVMEVRGQQSTIFVSFHKTGPEIEFQPSK